MSVEVRSIAHSSRGIVFRGSAYIPNGDSAHPAAVLYHGFGGQRIEASRLFVQLARQLADVGLATVAIDRAGHGESDGDFFDTTVSQDIDDSLHLLESISALDFVDSQRIHLLGISMGAVVASVVAAETAIPIRSLTMWSVAALFVDELRGGHLQGQSTDGLRVDGYFDFHGLRVGPSFFADAKAFDVYGRARGFIGPVRVLHGGRDFIPARYAETYKSVYGDSMQYTLVPEADHCWETVRARDLLLSETIQFLTSSDGS